MAARELTRAETRVSVHGNGACAQPGNVTFFTVATERLRAQTNKTHWVLGQIASMSRKHVLKHSRALLQMSTLQLEEFIEEVRITCLTVEQQLQAAHIDGPRELIALVIDAEGYDATILKTIDWRRLHPWLLIFEHVHLAVERAKRVNARLGRHGYVCALRDQENTYCLRDDVQTFSRCGA